MSALGKITKREINGEIHDVTAVTESLSIYLNPISGWFYAVDNDGKHRAAFPRCITAKAWCVVASKSGGGSLQSNIQIKLFNDAMISAGWGVIQMLGDCQVWDKIPTYFDGAGNFVGSAGASA